MERSINLNTRNRLIEIFSGILYNPYKFIITNVNDIENEDDQGLFRVLDNAIIDGIMIRNSRIDGTDYSFPVMSSTVGFLSSTSFGSFISNVSVEGDIAYDYALHSGGLIGNSIYSIYRYVSFAGSIKNSSYTGGIIGSNIGYFEHVKSLSRVILTKVNTIENSYVDADLSESYSIGGFIGYHYYRSELNLKSVYATGSIDRSQSIDYARQIGYLATSVLMNGDFIYEDAYTTYQIFQDVEVYAHDFDQTTFITIEEMYRDTPLEGLENFIFSTNDIPRLPYWRIGS
jgi:hypothetical protein